VNDRLYRSRDDSVLAGVCGGLAERLDIDPSLVRVSWVILTLLTGGLLFVVYIVMAIVVPVDPYDAGRPAPTGWAPGPPPPAPFTAAAGDASTHVTDPTLAGDARTPIEPADPGAGLTPATGIAGQQAWDAQRAERERRRAERAARGGNNSGSVIFGVILVAVGLAFLLPRVIPQFDFGLVWPFIAVGLGLALILASMRRSDRRDGGGGAP
jgi:phage shock protein PspC (stress-responsive transcriptional regulator)